LDDGEVEVRKSDSLGRRRGGLARGEQGPLAAIRDQASPAQVEVETDDHNADGHGSDSFAKRPSPGTSGNDGRETKVIRIRLGTKENTLNPASEENAIYQKQQRPGRLRLRLRLYDKNTPESISKRS